MDQFSHPNQFELGLIDEVDENQQPEVPEEKRQRRSKNDVSKIFEKNLISIYRLSSPSVSKRVPYQGVSPMAEWLTRSALTLRARVRSRALKSFFILLLKIIKILKLS